MGRVCFLKRKIYINKNIDMKRLVLMVMLFAALQAVAGPDGVEVIAMQFPTRAPPVESASA